MAKGKPKKSIPRFSSPLPWRRFGLLCGFCLLLAACAGPAEETQLQGATMGTSYTVKLVDLPPEQDPRVLQEGLERRLEQVNAAMSTYRSDSELSQFNRNPSTEWVGASPQLLAVLQVAQEQAMSVKPGRFRATVVDDIEQCVAILVDSLGGLPHER